MYNTRKILAILLAVVLVLALSVSAFAAKNDSITVNNVKPGETYAIYKLFDLSVNDEESPSAYRYTVNSAWSDFFTTGAGKDYVTIDAQGYVVEISDAAALAKAAAAAAPAPTDANKQVAGNDATSVVFTGLDDGYWLITSTLGTVAMTETTPDDSAVTVNEKNPEDTIEKQVKEDNNGWGKTNDAQIGDVVSFEADATLLPNTRNVKVHDTMDEGLTYNNDVAIAGLTEDVEYTVTKEGNDTFTIVFDDNYLATITAETTLTISYTATVNEKAIVKDESGVAIVAQNNTTSITFGDKQSAESETTTTTHSFSVFKHAKNSMTHLADAVFSLKKAGVVVNLVKLDDNNYRVAMDGENGAVATFTTVAGGNIVIWGVDADSDYTLEEITPPAGYNKLATEKEFVVSADNNTVVDIENNTGSELPGTGGIGTTIFYIVGGILVVGAAVVLISKKRMNTEQ